MLVNIQTLEEITRKYIIEFIVPNMIPKESLTI